MTRLSFFLLLTIALLFSYTSLIAQKKVDIYYFTFMLDQKMVDNLQVESKEGGFFSGYSSGAIIPEAIVDSIKQATEAAFSKKFKKEARCLLVTNKKGKAFETSGMEGGTEKESLEGLPCMQFKKAAENSKADLYLQILVSIEDGKGVRVDWGNGKSKLKPMITMKVKAYNANKKVVWKNDVQLKDFGKLRQKTTDRGTYTKRTGETLDPETILEMYRLALEEIVRG